MAYNRHIDQTEEALRELREVYDIDSIDRFIDGMGSGLITTEEQVIEFTNKIRTNDGLAQLEYSRLKKIVNNGFIEKFATNHNKRFNTVQIMMNRMRSSVSRGLKMLEDFCDKKRKKGKSKKKRHVINNSKLGHSPYNISMWGLEQFKESVTTLYKEVCNYKEDLNKNINLALEMIDKVNYVRSHPEIADEIYDNCHRKTVTNSRITIKRLISDNSNVENDILKKIDEWERQKKALKNLKAKLYHTLDEAEWNDLCICDEVMTARQQGITNKERALWGDNKRQVMKARVVYEHLDELEPEGQKGHIGGEFLAHLFYWSNILPNRGLDMWYTYFVESYKVRGLLTPVKIGAIKTARANMATEDKKVQEEFNLKIENLVKKYMVEPKEAEDNISEVVNF